jgi:hypothetical protein
MDDAYYYINFVLCAVGGRMREADAIMHVAGDEVRSAADLLSRKRPVAQKPLYRGILLDPVEPYHHDPSLSFLSWSEDLDVAKWFACRTSLISEYVTHIFSAYQGFLITLPVAPSRIIFHHSWGGRLPQLAARLHPEIQRQIAWSLATQSEVITEPIDGLEPRSVGDLDAVALDRRFAPPWITR